MNDALAPARRARIAAILLPALLALTLVGCPAGPPTHLEVAGQIEGVYVDAGSKVGGRVLHVHADEGDAVHEGDLIIELDGREIEAQVSAARAKLAQAEANLAKIQTGARAEEISQAEAAHAAAEEQYRLALAGSRSQEIDAARAAVRGAQAALDNAEADLRRADRLFAEGAVAAQMLDTARTARELAQAELTAAREQLEALVEGARSEEIAMAKANRDRTAALLEQVVNGARVEDLDVARALRDEAAAALALAEASADEMRIYAPMDGVIESLDVLPGDLVKPGAIVRVASPDELELRVYVSAHALGFVQVGDVVRITADSHGAETFDGRIIYIASTGEYTPRNLQTQEERVQQMFAVKIALDAAEGRLRAGMTATAHLDLTETAP